MEYTFEDVTEQHRDGILQVFNHYVLNDFAAFPTRPVGPEFFDRFQAITRNLPFIVIKANDTVVGFACLHWYHPADAFDSTVEISYFILPDHTGRGLATRILERFKRFAREKGIRVILASISSRNEGSIRFHEKHGFRPCGHFENIGRKFGKDFGVVWMQLDL